MLSEEEKKKIGELGKAPIQIPTSFKERFVNYIPKRIREGSGITYEEQRRREGRREITGKKGKRQNQEPKKRSYIGSGFGFGAYPLLKKGKGKGGNRLIDFGI